MPPAEAADTPRAPPFVSDAAEPEPEPRRRRRAAPSSTDAISSFLTRRFGLAGGLAWLGVLTFGVVAEQLKTREEVRREGRDSADVAAPVEVVAPSGLRLTDLRLGGGEAPRRGDLVAVDLVITSDDGATTLLDTRAGSASAGKPLAFFLGGRPLRGALCVGLEQGIAAGMRAGGRRQLVVPPALGPAAGTALPGGKVVPPGATLVYDVRLVRVSAAPS